MLKPGTVTRGKHIATFEEFDGIVRITSDFGTRESPRGHLSARTMARMLLGLQIGEGARQAGPSDKVEAARLLQSEWDRKWRRAPLASWADRPPPAEVVEAVASGWLPASGRIVDLGCGMAEIAAWFAERGYQATGIDIAQGAVERAAAKHGQLSHAIEYIAVDLCTQTLPDRSFDILIDRGCLHQIPPALVSDYVRNIASIAAPGARLLLFMKAFREGRPFGDTEETEQRTDWTRRTFAGRFDLERARAVHLSPDNPQEPLPGMAFWLTRVK